MRIPKIKPAAFRSVERLLRSVHGLPRHVRKLIGDEVAQSLVGKTVVLWRCRCGTWWKRFGNWCKGCESWSKRVGEMKLDEREAKSRAKRAPRGGGRRRLRVRGLGA